MRAEQTMARAGRRASLKAASPAARRIHGTVELVGSGHGALGGARQSAWDKLTDEGRKQFRWPTPGLPRTSPDEAFTGATDHAAQAYPPKHRTAALPLSVSVFLPDARTFSGL